MQTWFILHLNPIDVTCVTCVHIHSVCTLSNFGVSMYFCRPVYMQAAQNLEKITALHFGVLITQNANKNMTNMILIAELNKNLLDSNENLGVMNENLSFISMSDKAPELGQNIILHSFHVVVIKLNQSNYNSI